MECDYFLLLKKRRSMDPHLFQDKQRILKFLLIDENNRKKRVHGQLYSFIFLVKLSEGEGQIGNII